MSRAVAICDGPWNVRATVFGLESGWLRHHDASQPQCVFVTYNMGNHCYFTTQIRNFAGCDSEAGLRTDVG